jgi:hypothetical protein
MSPVVATSGLPADRKAFADLRYFTPARIAGDLCRYRLADRRLARYGGLVDSTHAK